jgi:hypothetical protein
MTRDVSTLLRELLDKLKGRGQSEEDLARAINTHGDVVLDRIAGVISESAHKHEDLYTISVDYDLPLSQAIDAGNYAGVNVDITSQNFPSSKHGQAQLDVILTRYDGRLTSEEVLSEMKKEGLRPVELYEFLAFGAQFPEMQRRCCIIGLGSVWQDRKGYKNVPCLYEASEARYLDLHWWDDGWYSYTRFAAIRK